MLRQSYNIYFSVYMWLMKFSVLWLHILFRPVVCVCISCTVQSAQCTIKDLISPIRFEKIIVHYHGVISVHAVYSILSSR